MLDLVTAATAVASIAKATGIVDKLAGQIRSFVERRAYTPSDPPPSTTIEQRNGGLVLAHQGRPVQTLTREDLAKRLSPTDLSYVQALERSMENHFLIWSAVYPQLALQVDPIAKARIEAQLRQILVDMRKDLHALLDFLSSIGLHLDDHYMHIRSLVDRA